MIKEIQNNFNNKVKPVRIMDLIYDWAHKFYSDKLDFYDTLPKIIRLDQRYLHKKDTYYNNQSCVGTNGSYYQNNLAFTINGGKERQDFHYNYGRAYLAATSPQLQIWFKTFIVSKEDSSTINKVYKHIYNDAVELINYLYSNLREWIFNNLELDKNNYTIEFYKCYNKNIDKVLIDIPQCYFSPFILTPYVDTNQTMSYDYNKYLPTNGIDRAILFPYENLVTYNNDADIHSINKIINDDGTDNSNNFIENFLALDDVYPKSIIIGNIINALTVVIKSKVDNKIAFIYQYHKENFKCKIINDSFMFYDVIGFKKRINAANNIDMSKEDEVRYNNTELELETLNNNRTKYCKKVYDAHETIMHENIHRILQNCFQEIMPEKYNLIKNAVDYVTLYYRYPIVTTDILNPPFQQKYWFNHMTHKIKLPPLHLLYSRITDGSYYSDEFRNYTETYGFDAFHIEIRGDSIETKSIDDVYIGIDLCIPYIANELKLCLDEESYKTIAKQFTFAGKYFSLGWVYQGYSLSNSLLKTPRIDHYAIYYNQIEPLLKKIPLYKAIIDYFIDHKEEHDSIIRNAYDVHYKISMSKELDEYLSAKKKLENRLYRLKTKGTITYGKLKSMPKLNTYSNVDDILIELNYYYDNQVNMIAKRIDDNVII